MTDTLHEYLLLFIRAELPHLQIQINGREPVCTVLGFVVSSCGKPCPTSQDTVHILECTPSNDMPEMSNKRTHRTRIGTVDSSRRFLQAAHCRAGELYLFCRAERASSSSGSLFGIFDKEVSGVIYMESSSRDMRHFRLWHRLPRGYRCSRRATRSELRDYIFNLACYECAVIWDDMGRSCRAARKIESCTH